MCIKISHETGSWKMIYNFIYDTVDKKVEDKLNIKLLFYEW